MHYLIYVAKDSADSARRRIEYEIRQILQGGRLTTGYKGLVIVAIIIWRGGFYGKSIQGTKSEENLKNAFAGESQANRR